MKRVKLLSSVLLRPQQFWHFASTSYFLQFNEQDINKIVLKYDLYIKNIKKTRINYTINSFNVDVHFDFPHMMEVLRRHDSN